MHEQLGAIVTVLSLINPAICAAMFARAVAGQSLGEKMTDATCIPVRAAIVRMMRIAPVAGGGALAWMGFAMLSPQPTAMDARPSVNELPKLKQNPVSGLKQIGLEAGASCRGG
jgi:hypothetical protein